MGEWPYKRETLWSLVAPRIQPQATAPTQRCLPSVHLLQVPSFIRDGGGSSMSPADCQQPENSMVRVRALSRPGAESRVGVRQCCDLPRPSTLEKGKARLGQVRNGLERPSEPEGHRGPTSKRTRCLLTLTALWCWWLQDPGGPSLVGATQKGREARAHAASVPNSSQHLLTASEGRAWCPHGAFMECSQRPHGAYFVGEETEAQRGSVVCQGHVANQ